MSLPERPEEEVPAGIRASFDHSLQRFEDLRRRLATNERRILCLEGRLTRDDPTWSHTVGTADAVITAVAAVEIIADQGISSGALPPHADGVLARTGLDADDIQRFATSDEPSRMGAVNHIQGHVGEQIALDLINSGHVPVPDGRVARLAASPNQPGWDLDLVDPSGQASTVHAQVKISDTAATIREHFTRYPDVHVVYANSEAAAHFAGEHGYTVVHPGAHFPTDGGRTIVDMGISHASVRDDALSILHGGAHEPLLQKVLTDVPLISLLLIAGRAMGSYLGTDMKESDILRTAGRRTRDVLIASGLGHAATAATSEPITGSVAAVGYLLLGNSIRAARGSIDRAADRFVSARTALVTFSPA